MSKISNDFTSKVRDRADRYMEERLIESTDPEVTAQDLYEDIVDLCDAVDKFEKERIVFERVLFSVRLWATARSSEELEIARRRMQTAYEIAVRDLPYLFTERKGAN